MITSARKILINFIDNISRKKIQELIHLDLFLFVLRILNIMTISKNLRQVNLSLRGKRIRVSARTLTSLGKISGLMGTPLERAEILLFSFSKPTRRAIHSFFVRFPFVAVWCDEHFRVLEVRKVTPWKLSVTPSRRFSHLLEIPVTPKYRRILSSLVGKTKHLNRADSLSSLYQ